MSEVIPHLSGPAPSYIAVVRIVANHMDTGGTGVFWFSNDYRHLREPTTRVDARLSGAPTYAEYLFGDDGRPLGAVMPAVGTIGLDNHDGGLDHLRHYEWARGSADVYVGPGTARYVADLTRVWGGRIDSWGWSNGGRGVSITIAEQFSRAERVSLPAAVYGEQYHGFPVDTGLVGTPKPSAYGYFSNARAPLVSPAYLVYHLGNDEVWEVDGCTEYADPSNPQPLLRDPPVDSAQDLFNVAVDPGHFASCPSAALVKIGALFDNSDIRFSWSTHDPADPHFGSTANAMEWVTTRTGLDPIDAASLDAHRALWPERVRLWLDQPVTAWQLLNDLASGSFSVFYVAGDGSLSLRPIPAAPAATPDHTMVFGDPMVAVPRWGADLSPRAEVQPFRTGFLQPLDMSYRPDAQPERVAWLNVDALFYHYGGVADDLPLFFEDDGIARMQLLITDYLGTAWRLWGATTEWDGTRFRAGQTIAVTDAARGLAAKPMLIVGVTMALKIPQGRRVRHVLPVTLLLAEVRDGR